MSYRVRALDPDYRRDPTTDRWCELCQRDLKPGQPHRRLMWNVDTLEAVHGEDWEAAAMERRTLSVSPVGMDCAKKLGLEFTRAPEEVR